MQNIYISLINVFKDEIYFVFLIDQPVVTNTHLTIKPVFRDLNEGIERIFCWQAPTSGYKLRM